MDKINWWHTFDFPELKTKGRDKTQLKLKGLGIPKDLREWSVLDVGAWDGYFSFLCEKRGAKKVLAIDTVTWQSKELWSPEKSSYLPHTGKAGFNHAKKVLKSKVEDKEIEVEDITIDKVGTFDLVLYLGIFYHMENPFKILRNLYQITNKLLIIETHTDGNYLSIPAMIFYPNNECNNDLGTWWGPNLPCLIEMLKVIGFKPKLKSVGGNRAVIHAYK